MATIRDIVADAARLSRDQTVYARRPWTPASEAVVAQADHAPVGLDYLLEADLAREVVAVWSRRRGGRQPTPDEAAQTVIHYATFDAYQPVEGD